MGYSKGQTMGWYHGKIPRISHGKQNSAKRYLRTDEILALFNGIVHIQEKVDGKLSCKGFYVGDLGFNRLEIIEDMTGKNTCHKHIEYRELPADKRIYLDSVVIRDDQFEVLNIDNRFQRLDYCVIDGRKLRLEQIFELLEMLSRLPSHFGRERIEGLIVKNYDEQLFGKWINEEFEDHIRANP